MKNIHVLPTDKPSRLYLGDNGNFVFGMIQTSIQSRNDDFTNQHIYITNDEEIKAGDWFISLYSNSIQRELILDWTLNKDAYKKIILTTDKDLIADGVQSIPDEFLEWFVNNPSCESVEIDKNWNYPLDKSWEYKLRIIPKEEPKQEIDTSKYTIGVDPYDEQETIEEVVNNFKKTDVYINEIKQEQDKKLYSEEEVIKLLQQYRYDLSSGKTSNIGDTTGLWFEQFKKK